MLSGIDWSLVFFPISLHTAYLLALLVALSIALYFATRPRLYYFVRHGETLLNKEHVKQGAEGALSEKGRAQAERVGVAFSPLAIHLIISSPYERAEETAQILATHLHAHVRTTALLAERKNPSEVLGKKTDDPEVVRIIDHIDRSYHEDGYRYSDEETFLEQRTRARRALGYLALFGKRSTCVVTHHAFLKMVIATMLYPKALHASDFTKLSFFNYSTNAGITVCRFSPLHLFSATRGWAVLSWDEHA